MVRTMNKAERHALWKLFERTYSTAYETRLPRAYRAYRRNPMWTEDPDGCSCSEDLCAFCLVNEAVNAVRR